MAGATQDGVPVRRLAPPFRIGNTPIDPGFTARVAQAIREHAADVVVAHTPVPFPAEMAYRAARRSEIPFVVTYHAGRLRGSSLALDLLAALNRSTIERRMLAGAQRLIAVGSFVRDHALARERERVTIVPPGVDAGRFKSDEAPEGPNILFVGPLSRSYRWKGIDSLWRAFLLVHKRMPDASLTIVGNGDRFGEFYQRARAMAPFVRLAGRVSEEALLAEYRRAAVVVLPSTTDAESFGMVLAEANACSRPVVASNIGGIPDFVRDGDNGLLCRPGDPADLAEKLVSVLADAELARQMGQRGRERVVREHDWDELAGTTERAFEETIQEHAARRALHA